MKLLTICSAIFVLALWNMVIAVRAAESLADETTISNPTTAKTEASEISLYEEFLLSGTAIDEKVLEEIDPSNQQLMNHRIKNLAKAKEELEYYRQNIAPASMAITNRFDERCLVDSITMDEWRLKNLSPNSHTKLNRTICSANLPQAKKDLNIANISKRSG